MTTITTDKIRSFLRDTPSINEGIALLLAYCDEREESPRDYGFEFCTGYTNDDALDGIGREGYRSLYYIFRYPQEKLPEEFTSRVYIFADESHPEEDGSEMIRFRGVIYTGDKYGEVQRTADSDREGREFETVRECLEWLNDFIVGVGSPLYFKKDAVETIARSLSR